MSLIGALSDRMPPGARQARDNPPLSGLSCIETDDGAQCNVGTPELADIGMRALTGNDTMTFDGADAVLRDEVERGNFAGFNYAVIHRGEVVARQCIGWADIDRREEMRLDHLFRIFSCTKLATSCAALQLWEQGRFDFDDPITKYIPVLGGLKVLPGPDAPLDSARPGKGPVRIRHLLTHTAGFTYSFVAPETPIARAYIDCKVSDPGQTLAQQMDALAMLPLLFEPGSAWNYSVATDVIGRLVEVLSGEPLDVYFERHIFAPLGMQDTFFHVPAQKQNRLAAHYIGDLQDPSKPGLRNADHLPYPGAYRTPVPRLNPGGGLVSSLEDYTRLVQALALGGAPLLKPDTMRFLTRSQIPDEMSIGFAGYPPLAGRGYSFAASVFRERTDSDPAAQPGDVQWSGLSGTQWMLAPKEAFGLVLMTQRFFGFGLPYWPKFKQAVRQDLM
jgi:CubicO group peptidase (beta-lactamase class C family)